MQPSSALAATTAELPGLKWRQNRFAIRKEGKKETNKKNKKPFLLWEELQTQPSTISIN
jgi:hypothetical protein